MLLASSSGQAEGRGSVPGLSDLAFLRARCLPPGETHPAGFLRRSPMQERYERAHHPIWACYLNRGRAGRAGHRPRGDPGLGCPPE